MALVRALGRAHLETRRGVATKLKELICETLKLEPEHYSLELPPNETYLGDYDIYLHIICDSTEERIDLGSTIVEYLKMGVSTALPDERMRAGVYLDLGTHRFWAEKCRT